MDAEDEVAWVEDADVDFRIAALVLGVKFLTNRAIAAKADNNASAIVAPTFKLLWHLMEPDGLRDVHHSQAATARLQLQAAVSLLKLAAVQQYHGLVMKRFSMLGNMVQVR